MNVEKSFLNNPDYFVHDVNAPEAKPILANEQEEEEEEEEDEADDGVFPHKPQPLKRPDTDLEEEETKEKKEKEKEEVEEEKQDFIAKHGAKVAFGGVLVLAFIMSIVALTRKSSDDTIPTLLNKWNSDNNYRHDYLVSCITEALKHKSPLEAKADWMQYLNENGLQNKEYDVVRNGNKIKLGNIGITEHWSVKRDLMGNPQQVYKTREFIT